MSTTYTPYLDDSFDEAFDIPHLPLDWNEDLTLEEYLERMEQNANIFNSPNQ